MHGGGREGGGGLWVSCVWWGRGGQGACMVGACMAKGGMHDRGQCMAGVHSKGSMHGRLVCMAKEFGACKESLAWQRGACVAGGMHGRRECMAGEMATAVDVPWGWIVGESCVVGGRGHAWWGHAWHASYWNAFLLKGQLKGHGETS